MGLLVVTPDISYPHEVLSTPAREESATRFEVFVAGCSLCVKDSYSVATLPMGVSGPSGFGPSVVSTMARGGAVRFEVVRAYPPAKQSQQIFVMRATLLIKAGDGQLSPVATGLLDDEEVTALATAVAEISKRPSPRKAEELAPDMSEIEFHGGSLRFGVIRIKGAEVAYIQAGDLRSLRPPSALETTHALFLPVSDLPALHEVIGQVERRIRELRGQ